MEWRKEILCHIRLSIVSMNDNRGYNHVNAAAAYRQAQRITEPEAMAFLPLVKRIAYHMKARLPASIDVNDLIQAGSIGLIHAANAYDVTQGASFETYANIRIRGQILDELRSQQWVSRSSNKLAKDIDKATSNLEQDLGRAATEQEIADAMNLSLSEYQQALMDAHVGSVLSFQDEEMSYEPSFSEFSQQIAGPADEYDAERKTQAVIAAINALREKDRECLNLYYSEELNLREIAEIYDISESAACLRLKNATQRLKHQLRDWNERT